MKKSLKATLLLCLVSLPLCACQKGPSKTHELQPVLMEQDTQQGLSDLGKSAKVTFQEQDGFSFELASDKPLSIKLDGQTHNAIENTDSYKKMDFAINGIAGDFRFAKPVENEGEDPIPETASANVSLQSVHWEYEDQSTKSARTRNNVAFSAFLENETLYFDPSDENFINFVKDVFDMAGFGDYKIFVSTLLSNKYYVNKADLEAELEPYIDEYSDLIPGVENPFEGIIIDYDAVGTAINNLIVFLDRHYEEYSSWLSMYGDGHGQYVLYATFSTEEIVQFILDYADKEYREDLSEALKDLDVTGLEFALTFDEHGLISLKTLFDLGYAVQTDAYDFDGGLIITSESTYPLPEKIGHTDWKMSFNGGFTLTFGEDKPIIPDDVSGYKDLIQMIKDAEDLLS